LLAVLSHHHEQGSVIVCNGYKDREYIRHALLGNLMGHKVYIVVEKPSELEMVLDESARLNIKPNIGVRARLASTGSGMWESSGGSMSKFGLSASQILALVERLRSLGKLDCLQLLHFHLGSQIANIRDIQGGIRECGRFYAELCRLGAKVEVVDVGGGLGWTTREPVPRATAPRTTASPSTPTTWSGASAMSAASSTRRTRPSSASPAVP
jgi:arginine decarboxylase